MLLRCGFLCVIAILSVVARLTPADSRPLHADHVFIIIMENESFRNIVKNPDAPTFNSLPGGLLTNYWGVAHPSLPNYVAMMGAGPPLPLSDNPGVRIGGDSFPEEMLRHGQTIKAYMQGLPRSGYGGSGYPLPFPRYVLKHDPFLLFSRVRHMKELRLDVQPLSNFSKDLDSGRIPEVSLIVPDLCHDMHGAYVCHMNGHELVRAGDGFLKYWIPRIQHSKNYQKQPSWIFILWDEGNTGHPLLSSRSPGETGRPVPPKGRVSAGGHIPFLWISGPAPVSWKSACFANHYSLLETLTRNFGLPELAPPGERVSLPVNGQSCRR